MSNEYCKRHCKSELYNFSEILYKLKEGYVIYRNSNKNRLFYMENVSVIVFNIKEDINHSYIFTNNDIFAEDWMCLGPYSENNPHINIHDHLKNWTKQAKE